MRLIHYETVTSTNAVLRELAQAGGDDLLTVYADEQTAGRGRLERKWQSEKGTSALFSVLIRRELAYPAGTVFSAALAAAMTLKSLTGADVKVKWPNDIVLSGKKLCGILCESALSGGKIDYIIVGIGINLNTLSFPDDLPNAGSVLSLTGIKLTAETVITEFCARFDGILGLSFDKVLASLSDISATLGSEVRAGEIQGTALRFDDDGALIIKAGDGEHRIIVGDVSVRGVNGYV